MRERCYEEVSEVKELRPFPPTAQDVLGDTEKGSEAMETLARRGVLLLLACPWASGQRG